MRNLKRALSLALASVMLLGMMVVGTSATTYSGSQPLTAVQAALMMLRALGYEHLTKDATDWRAPVTAMANKIGLFKDVVSSPNAQLTRNEVAQLALNALESDMVEFTGELGWEINGVTLGFQAKWEPRKDFGNTTNNGYNYTNDSGTTHQKEYLQLLESLYDGKLIKDTKDYDDFDRPATTWKYKGKVIGSYMNTPDLTYTSEVKLGDIYKDLGLNKTLDSADVDFYRNGQDEDVTTNQIKANDNSTLLSGVGLTKGDSHKIGANGVLTQVWYDSTDETAIITMIDTFVGKVNSTGTSNGNRYVVVNPVSDGEGQINISTGLINPYYQFETEKFAVKDMVTFTAAYIDGTTRHEVQSVDALELTTTGTLTRWEGSAGTNSTPTGLSGANFSVEGTKYNYSRNYRVADDNGGASAGRFFTVNKSDVNVYLDKYGYAIYVSGVETQKNYAAVIGVGLTNQYGSETRGVTLLLPDGTQKTVAAKLANDTNWNTMSAIAGNSKLVGINQIPSGDTTDAGKNLVSDGIADLVTYSVGDDNVYTLTVVNSVVPPLPSVTNYVAGFLGCGNGSKNVQVVLRAPDMHYLSRNEPAALNIKPEDITVTTNGFELHPFAADGEKGTIYGPGSGDTQGSSSQHSFATNPIAILPGYAYDGYSATKAGGMLNTYGANAGFLKIHLDGMLESGTLTITIKGSNGVTYTCEAYTVG